MFVKAGVNVRAPFQVLDIAFLTEDLADEILVFRTRLAENLLGAVNVLRVLAHVEMLRLGRVDVSQ